MWLEAWKLVGLCWVVKLNIALLIRISTGSYEMGSFQQGDVY